VIKGVHTMFYSAEAEALRVFLRDKLELPATDIGDGWLIFDLPEADMGVHPADATGQRGKADGTHDISFYCDDIDGTVETLRGRGVEFDGGIEDQGWGRVTTMLLPGQLRLLLYEPRYGK